MKEVFKESKNVSYKSNSKKWMNYAAYMIIIVIIISALIVQLTN